MDSKKWGGVYVYAVEESTVESRGKKLFIAMGIFRYALALFMAYWGSRIFATLGHVYTGGLGSSTSGIDCIMCPSLLKSSAIVLIILGSILIALGIWEKTRDYVPAGLIWILSGIYYLLDTLHPYKIWVLIVYAALFIWWLFTRSKDSGRLLGSIQIFMPLSLAGAFVSDDITVWLFSIFVAIAFEGIYLAIQGSSELAFALLMGIEKHMDKDSAISFLKDLRSVLKIQVSSLWFLIAIVLADTGIRLFARDTWGRWIAWAYLIWAIVYFISWLQIGIYMNKVHRAFSTSILLSLSLIAISILLKVIFHNTFIALVGVITGISVVAQIGPIYEYFIRKYTPAIAFDIYIDHISIVALFTLLIVLSYDKKAMSIMGSVSPFLLTMIGVIVKLLAIAFVMDTTINVIKNIDFALEQSERGI